MTIVMPLVVAAPQLIVRPQQLTQTAFAPFGIVIENTLGHDVDSMPTNRPASKSRFVAANQGTALKASNVSPWVDKYGQSKSGEQGQPLISMFSCFPRLLSQEAGQESRIFPVGILERHPYTTQTFVPMGLSPTDTSTNYLIIVAPTMPSTGAFPDRGPPDLSNLKAFVAHGRQAVTYGAATWHAPMVVTGDKRIDFVVVQSTNGIPEDDCQETKVQGEGLAVAVDDVARSGRRGVKL